MGRSAFLDTISGHLTIRTAIIFLVAVMGVIGGDLFIAWLRYEDCNTGMAYSMLYHQISVLGDPALNPCGWPFFTITLWALTIAAIPLLLFYQRELAALKAKVAGVFSFFFGLGIPGMAIVGIVPSSLDPYIHLVSAAVAFGGPGLAYLFSGFGLIAAKLMDRAGRIPVALVIPFLSFIPLALFGIAVQLYLFIEGIGTAGTWLSSTLFEWLLLFAILGMCISTTVPLVRDRDSRTERDEHSIP